MLAKDSDSRRYSERFYVAVDGESTSATGVRPEEHRRQCRLSRSKANEEVIVVQADSTAHGVTRGRKSRGARADVIELGGLERARGRNSVYTPNPRLYPGPQRTRHSKLRSFISSDRQRRKRNSAFRKPVPNARLYRPTPARPPAASPRTAWSPPSAARALDSASRAALRCAERRHAAADATAARSALPVRRPRVTLPAASSPDMDANRNSTSPDDHSEGNEPTSAPSEFLAEFLSAIMRRQYTEALKYCGLILQYEPHNATARGFYPLLQLKVDRPESGADKCDSSSEEVSASPLHRSHHSHHSRREESMEQEADSSSESGEGEVEGEGEGEGGSCASVWSLELDSSEVLAPSHSSASASLSRRTDNTDASGCWESDADDNGNPTRLTDDDLNDLNDNAAGTDALRRLRANFTCSIK